MDKKALLEQFEKTKTYDLCKSWQIDFDEKAEIYYSINPSYHSDVVALNAAWSMFQEQQAKVEELQEEFAEDERFLKEQIQQKDLEISNLKYLQGMDKDLIQTLQGRGEKLQKRVDLAILGINGAMRWVEEDVIDDPDFIKGGVLSALRRLEQALKGGDQ